MNSYRERMHITTTRGSARDIDDWDPEDVAAWEAGRQDIAPNLIWSIVAEHVGFSIWSIWSVMVLFMPQDVYHIDAGGQVLPGRDADAGRRVLRIPYTIAPAKFGGRNWTIVSALLLLIPTAADAVRDDSTRTRRTPRSWSSRRSPASAAATSPRR